MDFLKGKVSYIVAGVTILWAIVGFFLGNLDMNQASAMVLAGLGVFGIRRAIANQ